MPTTVSSMTSGMVTPGQRADEVADILAGVRGRAAAADHLDRRLVKLSDPRLVAATHHDPRLVGDEHVVTDDVGDLVGDLLSQGLSEHAHP